jgi:cytidine deaminase
VNPTDLDPEDAKLVTLARSARARTSAAEGAAVRDDSGRTYVAATVDLRSLQLTAVQAAVAAAVSSGAKALEAAAVVGAVGDEPSPVARPADRAVLDDLVGGAPLLLAGPDGTVRAVSRAG